MLADRYVLAETVHESRGRRLVRARDARLEREVFVLLPRPGAAREASDELREARAIARVRHPGLAPLLEVVETADGPALVLEPFEGESLRERVERSGPLSAAEARQLGRCAAEALAALHRGGLVHRGVSEHALFLRDDGSVVVLGFDFAKQCDLAGFTSLNVTDARAGGFHDEIPVYPAPEQWSGHAADARTDVFALGCTLHYALTGERVDSARPVPPTRCTDGKLAAAVDRCTARMPTRRFAGMAELAEALAAGVDSGSRRGPKLALVGGGALVSLLLAVLVVSRFTAPEGPGDSRQASADASAWGARPTVARAAADDASSSYRSTYAASRALLIGIDYAEASSPWNVFELANAERDVRAIRDGLVELGWKAEHVHELLGGAATRGGIEAALRALEREAGADDQVLIYYAGHGVRHPNSEESGWAIPADGGAAPQGGGEGERWLHFDRFDRVFREFRAKHILVAFDCCHGGAGMSRLRAGAPSVETGQVGAYLREPARIMIASSRPNEVALDGRGDHSPFAEGFLAALADARTRCVPARGLLARIQASLLDDHGDRQRPLLMAHPTSSPGAEFFFLQRKLE